ncbi:HlyD family secretion protein [Flaviaesturariibacter amylovorans]|uniref:Biotin/lipoyl-binding protein n=1 Tax=Flaviaesturariibacter amylovorans TaxID=1084520 RepID=A0ABP8GRM3_9BACT
MEPEFSAYRHVYGHQIPRHLRRWLLFLLFLCIVLLLLPWTQNIRARGTVTALRQEQRPQEINSIIAGRVEQWYVKEGDYVRRGDTIARLSEVKADYLDPALLTRTGEQISAKKAAIDYYGGKVSAAESQIGALGGARSAKLQQLTGKLLQLEAKLRADSMDVQSANNDWSIATAQYNRQRALHDSGLVSLTQLESRNAALQQALAKKTGAENRLLATRQEIGIVRIEFNAVQQEYLEKKAKAESDRLGSLSQIAGGQGEIAKLQNQYASYVIRNGMYAILAPQDGQVVKARASGIGEILKEGDMLVHIVPTKIDPAVELFVRPVDLPLVSVGQKVRFVFDGFPAIVFSGWPSASFGTFEGIVSAVESDVSANGTFRVLVREHRDYRPWPPELRIGTGANGIALLKNVPVWYELWRNINAFPPDYYKPSGQDKNSKK